MAKTGEFTETWEFLKNTKLENITDAIADIVNEIRALQAEGKYGQAAEIVKANPNLKKYILTADYINAIDEQTRNLEIDLVKSAQSIYVTDELDTEYLSVGDVWIGGDEYF